MLYLIGYDIDYYIELVSILRYSEQRSDNESIRKIIVDSCLFLSNDTYNSFDFKDLHITNNTNKEYIKFFFEIFLMFGILEPIVGGAFYGKIERNFERK